MEGLFRDVRHAGRTLLRNPGFTAVAVLTLGLGIGANTALFTTVNAVLLRPPAHVSAPERLVYLFTSDFSGPAHGASSYADFEEFRDYSGVFEDAAAYAPTRLRVGSAQTIEPVFAEQVSDGFFRVLGVPLALGRDILPEEARPGTPGVAVISHDLWQRRFASSPEIIGREIEIEGRLFPVVGVAPSRFHGAFPGIKADVWVPATTAEPVGRGAGAMERSRRGHFVIGRLRDDVSLARAQADLDGLATRMFASYPEAWSDIAGAGRRITVISEFAGRVPPMMRGPVLGFLGLLLGVVVIVLLICCANLAGLLLTRASGRGKEIAIRAALGATRRRLLRQMLTESFLISLLGTVAAGLVVTWAAELVQQVPLPLPFRLALDLQPDARVFAFMAALTVATTILVGLLPALRATRVDLSTMLRAGFRDVVRRSHRFSLGDGLVVAQITMSVLLLVGALLFLRTLQRAGSLDPGFRTENMLLVPIEPAPGATEPTTPTIERIREAVAALPGVQSVSWTNYAPLGVGGVGRRGVSVDGYQPAPGEEMEFAFAVVGPDYFETIEIGLVVGRGFNAGDREGAPGVAVVSEAFARHFWPGSNPVGRRLTTGGEVSSWLEVVGVAEDSRYMSLGEAPRPVLYTSALQEEWSATLVIGTLGDPAALAAAVRARIAATAPSWATGSIRTMQQQVGTSLLPQRVAGWVLSAFGVVAMVLAAVGLYGVVAYAAARRTREIGIRMALGASRRDVLRLVSRQSLALVGTGVVLGLTAAALVTRLLAAFLLGTQPLDPLTFIGAPLLLVATAFVATYLPARRATRVDPMVALRAE